MVRSRQARVASEGERVLPEIEQTLAGAQKNGAEAIAARIPSGNAYSVAYEMKLDPSVFGKSDSVHFNRANAALDVALRNDSGLADLVDQLGPGISDRVSSVGGRENPLGFTSVRNLTELNINEGGRAVPRNAPTPRVLEQFEAEFGRPLPNVLQRLLSFANGGHPELNVVYSPSGHYSVNRFYHLSDEDHGTESLWYSVKHWRSILGNKALPFANDSGGNQFFLDMNKDPAPVKICLHEKGFRIEEIAQTLEEFIDRLQNDPEMI